MRKRGSRICMIQNLFQKIEPDHFEVSDRICTPLKGHQFSMLQAMSILESGTFELRPGIAKIHSRYGVIGDPVGSGKTLVTLAACATLGLPKIPSRFTSSTETLVPVAIEHLAIQTNKMDIPSNLIIVPHHLEHQWIEEIQTRTKLRWIQLNRKTVASLESVYDLKDYDVVICKNTIFRSLWEECVKRKQEIRFSRLFVDEADTISLPKLSASDGALHARFFWMITGTPENIRRVHPRCPLTPWGYRNLNLVERLAYEVPWNVIEARGYLDAVILKNDPAWVKQCIQLDDPIYHRYKTVCPRNVHVLKGIIPEQSILCMNMDDMEGAMSYFDFVSDETTLIEDVTRQFCKTLQYEERRLVLAQESDVSKREQISIQKRIDSLHEKIQCIKERLENSTECPICYDDIDATTDSCIVLNCCNNKLCLRCLTQICKMNATCPLCKACIQRETIRAVQSSGSKQHISERRTNRKLTKTEMFRQILEEITKDPTRRILVFSESDGTWTNVLSTLENMSIPYRVGRGSSDEVRRRVNDFRDGKAEVLLLNSTVMGAGLNLQFVTDVVIYHTPSSKALERQMVGRANRQGRTKPLHVHIMDYF